MLPFILASRLRLRVDAWCRKCLAAQLEQREEVKNEEYLNLQDKHTVMKYARFIVRKSSTAARGLLKHRRPPERSPPPDG